MHQKSMLLNNPNTKTQKDTEKPVAQPIQTWVVKTRRRKSTACADTAIANESCNIHKPISVSVGRKQTLSLDDCARTRGVK